jgi:hypothetical protein
LTGFRHTACYPLSIPRLLHPLVFGIDMGAPNDSAGLAPEVRLIVRRAVDACRFVPTRQKWALGLAALLTAIAGATNTVIAIALGKMVDGVAAETKKPGRNSSASPSH